MNKKGNYLLFFWKFSPNFETTLPNDTWWDVEETFFVAAVAVGRAFPGRPRSLPWSSQAEINDCKEWCLECFHCLLLSCCWLQATAVCGGRELALFSDNGTLTSCHPTIELTQSLCYLFIYFCNWLVSFQIYLSSRLRLRTDTHRTYTTLRAYKLLLYWCRLLLFSSLFSLSRVDWLQNFFKKIQF